MTTTAAVTTRPDLGCARAADAERVAGGGRVADRGRAAGAVGPGALRIGPLEVDPPVVLAPMAGVTTAAFRTLCRRFGAGLYVSEMITARALVEDSPRTMRMLASDPDEPVRSVQLYGVDPDVMAAGVHRLVDELGVDHVDLNFGCPAPKVTRKGGGAALPIHHVLFRRVVAAAVDAAGAVPVTVKLRIGIDDDHRTALPSALAAEAVGAAAVTLHARTAHQLYSGRADWSAIAELKAAVRTIPVLGNGDIWDATDAMAMMRATGCDGVVIGRGCLGRPWLFAELAALFAGRPVPAPPRLSAVADTMRLHATLLAAQDGEQTAVRDFRKHTSWYLTGYPVGGAARRALGLIDSLDTLDRLLGELDPDLALPAGAPALPRGHSAGPRPVALPDRWLETTDDPRPPLGADALVSGG
jgi:nifR3 family TIM-barrel protein